MSEASGNNQSQRKEKLHVLTKLRTERRFQCDAALTVSALMLILSFLLYMIFIPLQTTLSYFGAAAVVTALYYFGKERSFAFTVIRRVISVIILLVALSVTAAASILSAPNADAAGFPPYFFAAILIANLVLPILLTQQTVLSFCVTQGKPFDLVMLRIVALMTLAAMVFMSFFALEYQYDTGEKLILTNFSKAILLFGTEFNINIDIDNIFTRALLCAGAAFAAMVSFLLKPAASGKQKVK